MVGEYKYMRDEDDIYPLPKVIIDNITTIEYKTTAGRDTECPICLEDFKLQEIIRLLPCMDIYHLKCIDSWLIKKGYCPKCNLIPK